MGSQMRWISSRAVGFRRFVPMRSIAPAQQVTPRSIDLRLDWFCDSVADSTKLSSSRRHSSARSTPRSFGTRPTSGQPSRAILLITASASAICGTIRGWTNATASKSIEAESAEPIDHLDLYIGRDGVIDVLKPIPRTDLDDSDTLGKRREAHCGSTSTSGTPGATESPAAQ